MRVAAQPARPLRLQRELEHPARALDVRRTGSLDRVGERHGGRAVHDLGDLGGQRSAPDRRQVERRLRQVAGDGSDAPAVRAAVAEH